MSPKSIEISRNAYVDDAKSVDNKIVFTHIRKDPLNAAKSKHKINNMYHRK